jgi:hypothetical protein
MYSNVHPNATRRVDLCIWYAPLPVYSYEFLFAGSQKTAEITMLLY